VGIIALIVLTVLRLFRLPINFARIITIFFLIFYAFLCNSTPPVVRAVLFFGFYIMAQMSDRLVSKWQILLLSLFIVTLINPALLFSVSLQFSYLAFMGIIFAIDMVKNITNTEFYDNLKQGFKLPFHRLLTYLFIIFFIQLMLIPATVHYFNIINLNVLIGNIVGMILVSFLLPLFFLILFTPSSFFLFPFFVQVAEFTTALFNQSIVLLSRFPFVFNHSQRLVELIIMGSLAFIGLMLIVYNKRKIHKWQGVIICVLSFAFLINIPEYKGFKIIFFNVGNADTALIRFSADDYMLIDLADYENNSRNISRHLIPYLRRENVHSINKVLLTHAHDDHYGGIFRLSSVVHIDTLIVTQRFIEDEIGQQLLNHANLQNTYFFVISDTLTLRYRDYSIKFLHPDKDFVHRHENNHSIVCKVTYQGLEILFTGDIQLEAERYLLGKYPQYLRANILKAAHHGSRTSSHEQFMSLVNPELFVISATGNTRRGFPNRRVLDIAGRTTNHTFVTGRDSAVIIQGFIAHR
jgi:competence protein ComEC